MGPISTEMLSCRKEKNEKWKLTCCSPPSRWMRPPQGCHRVPRQRLVVWRESAMLDPGQTTINHQRGSQCAGQLSGRLSSTLHRRDRPALFMAFFKPSPLIYDPLSLFFCFKAALCCTKWQREVTATVGQSVSAAERMNCRNFNPLGHHQIIFLISLVIWFLIKLLQLKN